MPSRASALILPPDATTNDLHTRTNVHSSPIRLVPVLGLLQGSQPLLEALMIPTWGYLPLVSRDKLTLVQIFTDLETGKHLKVTVAHRAAPYLTWLPPIEVERT